MPPKNHVRNLPFIVNHYSKCNSPEDSSHHYFRKIGILHLLYHVSMIISVYFKKNNTKLLWKMVKKSIFYALKIQVIQKKVCNVMLFQIPNIAAFQYIMIKFYPKLNESSSNTVFGGRMVKFLDFFFLKHFGVFSCVEKHH